MSGLDDVKRGFAEWCAVAGERAAEAAKVTSRRYDKFALGREIERRLGELGAVVYEGLQAGREDPLADPRVAELAAAVAALERERAAKDDEIAGIRGDYAARRAGEADGPSGGGPAPAAGG